MGYSFLDAAAGTIHLGVLPPSDDEHGTALATLLAQVSPAEVLVQRRGRVSDVARRELVKCAAKPRVTARTAGEEAGGRGEREDRALGRASGSSSWRWASSATVAGARPVARACAAAVAAHLDASECASRSSPGWRRPKPHDVYAHGRVRMDATTMTNLELVLGAEGTAEGSTLRRISTGACTDAAASRTLASMDRVAASRRPGTITERQDAVWAAADRGSAVAEAVESAMRGLRGRAGPRTRGGSRARRAPRLVGGVGKFALSLPPHLARPRHARRVAALAAAAAAARRAWRATNDFAAAIGDDDANPALFRRFVEAAVRSERARRRRRRGVRGFIESLAETIRKRPLRSRRKRRSPRRWHRPGIPAATTTTRRMDATPTATTAGSGRFLEHSLARGSPPPPRAPRSTRCHLSPRSRGTGVRRSPCAAPFS